MSKSRKECKTCYGRGFLLKPAKRELATLQASTSPLMEELVTEHMPCPECQGMDQWLSERVQVVRSESFFDIRWAGDASAEQAMIANAASAIVDNLLEAGAFKVTRDTRDAERTLRGKLELQLSVVMPIAGEHTFAKQLAAEKDAAYQAAVDDVLSELLASASRHEAAGYHGPTQALAMRGFVETMRERQRRNKSAR